MASVAADPGAIAPPLPPPNRSDAPPPAGASSAFADLLDASASAAAPQPQATSAARADGGTSTAQGGAAAGNGTVNADPATAGAASSGPRSGKDTGSKDANGQTTPTDNGTTAADASVDLAVVVGLLMPPFPIAPLPNPTSTPTASQDTQGASADAAPSTGGNAPNQSDDRKDASAPSDALQPGLVAALPSMVPIPPTAPAPDSATPVWSDPIASLPSMRPLLAMSAPIAAPDVAASAVPSPQPDGTAQPSPKSSGAAQDTLPAVPFTASAPSSADELQIAALPMLPMLPLVAAATGGSDQNARSAATVSPVATPVAPSGPSAPLTPVSVEIHVADHPADNAAPAHEAESISIALPAQVAVRFVAAVRASAENTPDSGSDVMSGFASTGIGATSMATSASPVAAILASFNPAVTNPMQAPTQLTTPPHAGVTGDAVPLAGIPVAIVAHAEAGEKRFEIRLDPPDLGRIEVQLNVDANGRATSHLVVDRADTLDLLRRDAPALERALQSAGLTTGDGALQFSLRDQSFAGRDQSVPAPVVPPAPTSVAQGEVAPIDTALRRYGLPAGLGGGVDIRV